MIRALRGIVFSHFFVFNSCIASRGFAPASVGEPPRSTDPFGPETFPRLTGVTATLGFPKGAPTE